MEGFIEYEYFSRRSARRWSEKINATDKQRRPLLCGLITQPSRNHSSFYPWGSLRGWGTYNVCHLVPYRSTTALYTSSSSSSTSTGLRRVYTSDLCLTWKGEYCVKYLLYQMRATQWFVDQSLSTRGVPRTSGQIETEFFVSGNSIGSYGYIDYIN